MEEFIFDDEVDEVGAEVEAHCPKCKVDTTHVVIQKYEEEIRRVQCNPCGDVHAFKKPHGDSDETPEMAPAPKKRVKAKPTYDQAIAKWKKAPRTYAVAEHFKELEVLTHPKFGIGFVSETLPDNKIEVSFKEDKRVLIHNRKGMLLPYLAGSPSLDKKKKGKGKVKAAARPASKKPVKARAHAARPFKRVAKPIAKTKAKAKAKAATAAKKVKARPARAAKSAKKSKRR